MANIKVAKSKAGRDGGAMAWLFPQLTENKLNRPCSPL